MQLNVAGYLERVALVTCPDRTAVMDGANRYTFADVERRGYGKPGRHLDLRVWRLEMHEVYGGMRCTT